MLRLVEGEPGLWDRFQEERVLSHGLTTPSAPSVRVEAAPTDLVAGAPADLVVPRWERSRSLRIRPDGPAHPLGVSNQDLATRREAAFDGLRVGNSVIEALEAEVTPRGFLSILTDADGVIVRARGGALFPDAVRSSRLVEGARWDEGARGTNAIGTAIAESQPVAVLGRAHFEPVNHGLFCYAAPVRDAFGDRVAVIDVSGPIALDQPEIGAAVRGAASALEDVLRAHAYTQTDAGSRRFLERMIDRSATITILLEAPGVVRKMNDAAAAELDGGGAYTVERLFGIGWSELVRESARGPLVFETRRRRFRVDLEPILGTCGRTLALVCFLSAEPPSGKIRSVAPPTIGAIPAAFDSIVGQDAQIVAAKQLAARLAPAEIPIVLLAETGTGKELFAHAIHDASRRASGPFVALNCGAFTTSLLESELFGYAPSSFTGASRAGADGKLAVAHGGTLFLDEVAEMPAAVQAMLLRFLEDGSYSRVGEPTSRRADVRLVCATCRDLPKLVQSGAFRSDLFFRIQGGCIRLPPLRARTDRLELARSLVRSCARAARRDPAPDLAPSAEAWILDHSWPGNVRELKTAVVHALAVADGRTLAAEHFPEALVGASRRPDDAAPSDSPSRREALHGLAEDAVARAGGNMSRAARALGVARSTLYRMLDRRS
jgi:transcriptional regulator of acetoin/glycerol metabolism